MSTGEATRLLFTPYRRKIPLGEEGEEEGKVEEETKSQGEAQQDPGPEGSVTDRSQESVKTGTTTTVHDYRENIDLQRSWYNLVCYGLPNLIVTQM